MDISIYCLTVAKATSDYKRPSVTFEISHYTDLSEAKAEAQAAVEQFVYITHNLCAKVWNNGDLQEHVYTDGVVENAPIEVRIYKLDCQSPGIIVQTVIIFKVELDEEACPCENCGRNRGKKGKKGKEGRRVL